MYVRRSPTASGYQQMRAFSDSSPFQRCASTTLRELLFPCLHLNAFRWIKSRRPVHTIALRKRVSILFNEMLSTCSAVTVLDTCVSALQIWVGRLAMMGFLTSIVEEFITGKGTLRQIGFETPSTPLFTFLLIFFGGLTAYFSARTLYKATNKQLTATYVSYVPC